MATVDGKNIFIELLHMYSQDPVTIVRVSTSLHRYCLYSQTCGPPFCQYFLSLKLLLHFYYQFSLFFFYLLFPRHTLPYKLQKVKKKLLKMSVCACSVICWFFQLLVSYPVRSLLCCWGLPDRLIQVFRDQCTLIRLKRNYCCPSWK